MKTIFASLNYRAYLREQFPQRGEARGRRKLLSERIGCQTSFVSQVLTDRAHFPEEMLFEIAQFLKLNALETEYLFLIYAHERAAANRYKNFLRKKIDQFRKERSRIEGEIAERETSQPATIETPSEDWIASQWTHTSVRVALLLPELKTAAAIASKLLLSQAHVQQILEDLLHAGFIQSEKNEYRVAEKRFHLSRRSKLAPMAHLAYRAEMARHVVKSDLENFHFAAVYALSKKDVERVREIVEDATVRVEKLIAPSAEEALAMLCIDWVRY